jgi:branched-chain amino acid transport system substrate-binding protein
MCCGFWHTPRSTRSALSLAITGPTSDAGNPYSKGVEDYFRYVNDTKMLGNDKVECMIRDDQYQNDVTKRNFEEFLDAGMEFYLNYSTGSTLALKRDFEEEKIPVLPASFPCMAIWTIPIHLSADRFLFDQCIGLAEYIVNNHKDGVPKVAMFIHPSAFGRGPVEDVKKP